MTAFLSRRLRFQKVSISIVSRLVSRLSDESALGRRVRVTLIAVCCDHPALCRLCGFADHNTVNFFCPRCEIKQEDLLTPNGVKIDGMLQFIMISALLYSLEISIST